MKILRDCDKVAKFRSGDERRLLKCHMSCDHKEWYELAWEELGEKVLLEYAI